MRILHLTTEFPPVIHGGLGTAVGGLVAASARDGMTVAVMLVGETSSESYRPPQQGRLASSDWRLQPVNPSSVKFFQVAWSGAVEAGVQLARQWRPDVVHLHSFWLSPIAFAIQARTGTPLVYTVHSLDRAEYEFGQGPPECLSQWVSQEAVIAAADRVIALTQSERELLEQYCPRARDRVRVVGNGIDDCDTARTAARRKANGAPLVVLYTGRFVDRKGIRELLAAIPRVLDEAPSTRFVLAGGHCHARGTDMERWWLAPPLRPYRSHILFTGWLPPEEVARWYCAADLLIVPSWYEPFGMVILEGMLHGLAIAAAAVGGPAEILQHGRTGVLFPPRDVQELSDALLYLINDQALRRRLGAAAAAEVRRAWLWPHLVEKFRSVYQEVIHS